MPSTYAHYRFGCDVYRSLPKEEQKRLAPYLQLFRIGLHGPDLMFYYKPLVSNRINQIGYDMHRWSGTDFFERQIRTVRNSVDPEAARAYLAGLVCHYTLDSVCHPYIQEKIEADHVYHTEIESSFDRMLLVHDGFNPRTHALADHIRPSFRNAQIIAPFFQPAGTGEVREALRSMIWYNDLLASPRFSTQALVTLVLLVSGNYPEMHGMRIPRKTCPIYYDSNRRLYQLYCEARRECPQRIADVDAAMENGMPLPPRFLHTFGAE